MIASRKALIVVAAFVLMAIGLPWGGNVPAAFAQNPVTSANPPTGDQGTLNLNVTHQGQGVQERREGEVLQDGHDEPGRRQRQVHEVRELHPADRARSTSPTARR